MLDTDILAPTGDQAAARSTQAAQRAGVAPDQVERLPFDLSVLEDGGIFVVRRTTCD